MYDATEYLVLVRVPSPAYMHVKSTNCQIKHLIGVGFRLATFSSLRTSTAHSSGPGVLGG